MKKIVSNNELEQHTEPEEYFIFWEFLALWNLLVYKPFNKFHNFRKCSMKNYKNALRQLQRIQPEMSKVFSHLT